MIVRAAVPADEDALYDLLMALNAENNSFGDELDEERIRQTIRTGTEAKGGCHGVIDGNSELAGSVGLTFDRWWYGKNYMLAQLWLYVRRSYRREPCEKALIDWAKDIRAKIENASSRRLPLVNTVISEQRLPAKLRLWRRRSGGEMIGGIFLIK